MGTIKSEKMLPHDIEAEAAVLSCMLIDAESIAVVIDRLIDLDFYRNAHRLIFSAIKWLYESGKAVDIITTKSALEKFEKIDEAGGIAYLNEISDICLSSLNIQYYIDTVHEMSIRRKVISLYGGVVEKAFSPSSSADNLIKSAEDIAFNLHRSNSIAQIKMVSDIVPAVIESIEYRIKNPNKIVGLETGLGVLDNLTGGILKPSNLLFFAARPGMGKTALALNIASNLSAKGKSIYIASLEMSEAEIAERLISGIAGIGISSLIKGVAGWDAPQRVARAAEILSKYKIFVDCECNPTLNSISSRAQKIIITHGPIDLIIIDHLQLMGGDDSKYRENRNNEIGAITGAAKAAARKFKVPIIILTQLNRKCEERANRRPQLADMRDSGSIEQDADLILGLYRDHVYNNDADPSEAELIILKNRHGIDNTTIDLNWCAETTRFTCIDRKH